MGLLDFIRVKKIKEDMMSNFQREKEDMMSNFQREKERILFDTFERSMDMLNPTNDHEMQKKILKENLYQIEVEISSFCNRTCWFCPNSKIDRRSNKIELDEKLFLKIIENLREINYSNNMCFHRYNETLYDRELILKRLKQARLYLPNAHLLIATNGDYLNREYLDELVSAGVNDIGLSYYFPNGEEFNIEKAKIECDKMSKKLGIKYNVKICNDNQYYADFIYPGITFEYRVINFRNIGFNRAGTIEILTDESFIRNTPCYFPFGHIFIDYNGSCMPCCHMRSDVDEHKPYILGDINKNNLFEIFTNNNYINMRLHLYSNINKKGPCSHCYSPNESIIYNWIK
ncbi:SPASM domain-containing protein [Brachyspira pilosicoli]|uniref:radical SAM/SPASM domain-containing protein n=1 Tax=Brachyspira pilosicoli TaxID=52584 RepID=UPI003007EF48